jgi:membrane fusion protein (multidrug efflux system)
MASNRKPDEVITTPTEPDRTYADLKRELEALRERQQRLDEEYRERPKEQGQKQEPEREQKPEAKESPAEEEKRTLRQRAVAFPREHPIGFLITLALLAGLLVGSYYLWQYFQSYESTDDAQVNGHLHAVGSRVNGTVVAVHVENGQTVTPNQTLVELDPRDYQVALQQAHGDLGQAKGQLAAENPNLPITETTNVTTVVTAEADVASADAAVAAAKKDAETATADLRQAQANNVDAQAEEARYRQLVAKDEVSREQYSQRLAAAQAAQAAVDARRAAVDAAQKAVIEKQAAAAQARSRLVQARANNPRQIEVRQATITERKGAVDTAQAKLDNAALQLSYTKILAPVAGIIGNRNVEAGQRIQAGEQLLVITQMNDLWVDGNFKETQIRQMHPGQRVTIHVDALGQDFEGYIENLPGATGAEYSLLPPENATGNYVKVVQRLPVRIRFRKDQAGLERLRPGMSVEPKVWLK